MRWGMTNQDAVLEAVKYPACIAELDYRKSPGCRRRRAWPAGCRRRSRRRRCCSSEARAVVLLPWVGRARTVGLLPLLLQRPPSCAAPTRALHVTQGEERSAYVRNRRRGRGGAECRARTWSWRGTPPSWPWTACLWSPGRRDEARQNPKDGVVGWLGVDKAGGE